MTFTRRTMLHLLSATMLAPVGAGLSRAAGSGIDWAAFLARHDLVWDRMPHDWDEGPFLGNGMLGAMFYHDAKVGALRIDLGRADVQDHRSPLHTTGYDRARLPIGHFLLKTVGNLVDGGTMRLVLHDAQATATIVTDRGRIDLTVYVHAQDMAIVVDTRASAGERDFTWDWVGEEAVSPRQQWGIATGDPKRIDPDYRDNPPGAYARDGAERLWLQPLLAGGGTATAWRATPTRLVASVAHRFPGDGARAEALAAVRRAIADPMLAERHRAWWHAYYPASFVSLTDTRMESFYWIQMYKLAAATRAERAYVDNQGPWLQPTAWPYATWNLNVQLTYWCAFASNRAQLAGSLVKAIHDNQDRLIANVAPQYRADSATLGRSVGTTLESPAKPPNIVGLADGQTSRDDGSAPEIGNLPWALHDVWLAWRHTMDEAILRDTLFPVLRRTTNYYRHFLRRGSDGKLHLPPTFSPEYGSAPDLNYDLALLRWSCLTLIDAAQRLRVADPLIPVWRVILADLVDYPRDATGFMIGAGLPLESSHRHYSHLLMAYPLYLVNREQPGGTAIIQRSIDHWQSMPELLRGYSSTGAASLSAALGQGDVALAHLTNLFSDYLRPNTLYKESGPVIETPLSGAQSILDMLLQSWGGTIRPFPAMPRAWPHAVYQDLSAEGGFLVSARRASGITRWIRVTSRAGEPFAILTDIANPVATVDGRARPLTPGANGHLACPLARGETVLIHPHGRPPDTHVAPIVATVPNSFGLNARNQLKDQRDMSLPSNPGAPPTR